ncbi:hypothetical protein [Maribacter arcticus]
MKSITSRISLISSILLLVVVSCVKGMDMKEEISTSNSTEE